MLTNRKAPPPSQCHPIHRPLAMHPRLSSPMVWALPTTQGLRAQEVDPVTQQHPLTRLLGQQMHQNKKHWCRKGSHTYGAAFNACLITCFKRVLPFLGPSKATLWWNLPNSLGVRRAEASNNVRCSNPELCCSTSVPGRRVHAHISHRCPSVAMATAVRICTGEHLNQPALQLIYPSSRNIKKWSWKMQKRRPHDVFFWNGRRAPLECQPAHTDLDRHRSRGL